MTSPLPCVIHIIMPTWTLGEDEAAGKSPVLSVRLPRALLSRLKLEARRRELEMSTLVRQIFQEHFERAHDGRREE